MRLFFALRAFCSLTLTGLFVFHERFYAAYRISNGQFRHSKTFGFDGSSHAFVVLADVTEVTVRATGAEGGHPKVTFPPCVSMTARC